VRGVFCLSRPAIFGSLVGFYANSSPLQPVERRTGRIAGRAGHSAAYLLQVRRSSPRAGFGSPRLRKPPGASVRWTSAARAAPRPHFQNQLRKRPRVGGDAARIRGVGDRDKFAQDSFAASPDLVCPTWTCAAPERALTLQSVSSGLSPTSDQDGAAGHARVHS
jgi:hypothetical protein